MFCLDNRKRSQKSLSKQAPGHVYSVKHFASQFIPSRSVTICFRNVK